MENASDALMMAFGVLIFVMALTVAINSFSQAREVSDIVLFSADETNFYDYYDEVTSASAENRIVGLETIIPTLYKYHKEKYTVLFRTGSYTEENGLQNIKPLKLYTTVKDRVWKLDEPSENYAKYWQKIGGKYKKFFPNNSYFDFSVDASGERLYSIFAFDTYEEISRYEPWSGSESETKEFLDCFINGKSYTMPSDGSTYISSTDFKSVFGGKSFLEYCSGKKFIENISETKEAPVIDTNEKNDKLEELERNSRINKDRKTIYIFTLIE